MFTAINWKTYSIIIAIVLFAWYLSLFLWHNKANIQQRMLRKKEDNDDVFEQDWTSNPKEDHLSAYTEPAIEKDNDEMADEAFEQAGELSQRIKDLVRVAQTESYSKTAFINSLSTLTQQYPELNVHAFRVAINNKIKTACSEYKVYRLSEEDLEAVWAT